MINTILAQINVGTIQGPGGGPLSNPGNNAGVVFGNVLSGAVGVMTIIAAIWFLFQIILGGISIIGAGGDPSKVESGRNKIQNGIVGFIVVISATLLVGLVAFVLRIDAPLQVANWINIIGL